VTVPWTENGNTSSFEMPMPAQNFEVRYSQKLIVTIEARHSGAVGQLIGKSISPSGAYDVGASMKAILKAVAGTGFIVS